MTTSKKQLNIEIGTRIKAAREAAHLTQERMAEVIDVSVQFVSDVERGKVGVSLQTLVKICQILHISSDQLLFGTCDTYSISSIAPSISQLSAEQTALLNESVTLMLRAFSCSS